MKLGVYVGGEQDTSIVPQDYYVTFQVTGAKPISVRQVVTTDAAGDLAETIHTAVSGNAKGVITFEGSTIHAYGNLQYLGGDAEFNKAHSAWTVTGDLGRFLKQAHTETNATSVYCNGIVYTWGTNVIPAGQYERYDDDAGEYVSILADLVDAAGYGEDADGKYFDVSFNGVTIRFMVHLDTTLKTNSSTGKQE